MEAITEAEVDHDDDGYVDIDEIYRYVERSLKEAGPQQAQRGYDEASGTVALARRSLTPDVKVEPRDTGPLGPTAPPSLNVTPERIDVTDVRSDDLPVFERIFVFNRGGGDLEWRAESDEDWIGLEQFEDFVRVTLEPRSPGTNKGTVYVRDGRGAIERVPVRVEIDRRQGSKSRFWSRYKRPILAAGAFLGAVALVGVVAIALISDGVDGGRPVRTEMVLEWHHEQLDPSDAPGRIEAIGGPAMAAGSLDGDAAAWALADGEWHAVPSEDGDRDETINGLPPWDGSWVGVGRPDPRVAWMLLPGTSPPTASPRCRHSSGGPGDQVITRASKAIDRDRLVAVGYDGDDAAVWVFGGGDDSWERLRDEDALGAKAYRRCSVWNGSKMSEGARC